tara:strand:- start:1204 stop:1647 length:444 start_codon:yes stop_codon:yes gene_type:complete
VEKAEKQIIDWREKVSSDQDFYLNSLKGREKLSNMARSEEESIRERITRNPPRTKEIIWFSRYCSECTNFTEGRGKSIRCNKYKARLVKPLHGRPVWNEVTNARGDKELLVKEIDWNERWVKVREGEEEKAIAEINSGRPYNCFEHI